jgi:hypothetical protein
MVSKESMTMDVCIAKPKYPKYAIAFLDGKSFGMFPIALLDGKSCGMLPFV